MSDDHEERVDALEEEYFRRKEEELVERLRRRAEAEASQDALGEESGFDDEAILQTLHDLGFTRETVTLLHVVPLIHVAWIDGGVSQRERDLIFEIAATRGVDDGTPAWRRLADWLETRPSEDFFADSLRIVGVLARAGAEGPSADDLVWYSTRVAQASGGILGFGNKVTEAERDLIELIADEVQRARPEATQRVIDRM